MKITLENILKSISSTDVFKNREALDKLAFSEGEQDAKVHYILDYFLRTFANLPLREVPVELGKAQLSEFFKVIQEYILENKLTLQECKSWKQYRITADKVYEELSKNGHNPNSGW